MKDTEIVSAGLTLCCYLLIVPTIERLTSTADALGDYAVPEIILQPGWDNPKEPARYGRKTYNNHESNLSGDDMKALVMRILEIPGMSTPSDSMHPRIKALSECLLGGSSRNVLRVIKGIHMRETEVHFTMGHPPTPGYDGHFEIMLMAKDKSIMVDGKATTRFEYVPVGIAMETYKILDKFPSTFAYTKRLDHGGISTGGVTRPRGMSIGNSTPPPKDGSVLGAI